ncbi:hypothetical protein FBFR_14195 [Flavobacterium fryxellicola]|uniref:Uncharacterized protein n=1 Tax=Flavobacterium fryxellicola TaxID=249352 RepID=A0A167UJP9_9FLAO|nr:hypothetical protein FBFR_14195 [Flavobacterium fryxellicola]
MFIKEQLFKVVILNTLTVLTQSVLKLQKNILNKRKFLFYIIDDIFLKEYKIELGSNEIREIIPF